MAVVFAFFRRRQRPEEAVGHDMAHAGAEAGVERLVEEAQRLGHRRLQFHAGGQQRRQRRAERVAGTDEAGVEALELLARERALRRGQHVVDVLLGAFGDECDAGDEHEARAVFGGRHGELARRRRALAVPLGQQEVLQRLVVAHQHLGGRQYELAEGVEVGLQLVFVHPAEVGQVGDERDLGVVGQHLGHGADVVGRAQEADLPAGDRDVFEDRAGLLGHDVGIDVVLIEDVGGVAHDDARDHRQRMRAHCRHGGHVASHAAGAAGFAGVEAHHRGRRRRLDGRAFRAFEAFGEIRNGVHVGWGMEGGRAGREGWPGEAARARMGPDPTSSRF